MALTVQNLRAVGSGVEPNSLLPGQVAFNITDKVIYVGDGSNFKTNYDGTQVPGVTGGGWYAMPMSFDSLGDYYIVNPEYYGDVPTDGQVLTWSQALNHTIWTNGGAGGGNQVYIVTNAQVAAAPGATTSDKITAAIGVASPDEGNVTIVTGLPDDVYEGLYFFAPISWVKGAAYAYPSASEVIYNNTGRTLGATVQAAIDDLDDGLIATTAIANTANSTANSALSIASAALPRAGGTMTGTLVSQNIDVQGGFGVQFSGGVNGTINGINDSINATSSTVAASGTAVKAAYDIGAAALPRSGGTMTGTITFAAGQIFPVSGIQDATGAQKGIVQVGTNIQVASGVISILDSTVSNKGVVQLDDSLTSNSTTLALTARAGFDLQGQIDSLTLASNVILAGSLNATTGLLDSTTSLGAATVPPFVAGFGLPVPQASLNDYYVLVTVAGSYTPPGASGGPYNAENGDWFLCGETSLGSGIYVWQYLGVGARPQSASYITAGIVQLADTAVTYTGTSDTEAVTPNSLQDKLSDSTNLADSNRIASSAALKTTYDLANAALPKAGGIMTGDITMSGAGVGVVFNDASTVEAISDSVSTTSSVTAASSTAVKSSYDLANAALARSGGTMTGAITFVAGQTFPISGIQDATTGQKGVVQIGSNIQVSSGTISVNTATTAQLGVVQVGSNIDVSSGTISVKSSTTSQSGIVQLNDTLASTSTTQALTANMGRDLQVQINALATSNNLTFAGTIDGATGLMLTVTVEGAAAGFSVGSVMPSPSAAIKEYFTIISVAGTMTPPGGVPTQTYVGDWWLASSSTWTYIAAGFQPPYASTTTPGLVRLSTNAETQTGTDATEAVTPASLQSKVSDSVSTTSSTTIASSTAVKSAYDLANAAVPTACYTALGSLVAGTGSGTIGTLGIGTNGQFLAANTSCSTGVQWCTISLACIPCSAFTSVGQILAGTGTSTFAALGIGTNNQILSVDTACATGLKWITASGVNLIGYTCSATPFNTALGFGAGDSITTGTCNTSFGHNAGTALTSGVNNVAIGPNALDCTSVGGNNVAIGPNALGSSVTTVNNLAIGFDALGYAAAGNGNLAVGISAGANVSTGINNVFIAQGSGDAITTGACNISIGFNSLGGSTTACETIAIGVNSAFSGASPTQSVLIGASTGCATNSVGSVFIGHAAGCTNTTAGCTTYVGFVSGRNATGLSNTYVGALTGCATSNTSACGTLFGFCAGSALTTGNGNVLLGFQAGRNVNSGANNVAIGTAAFQTATTATNNVAVGCGALSGLSTSSGNTALGHRAMLNASTAANNVAVGCNAGEQLSTGSNNVLIGDSAGDTITTGTQNTFVGSGSGGLVATTSEGNTGVGFSALGQGVTSGAYNTAVGNSAGLALTSGALNTLVGYTAGQAITTGGSNTLVGRYAGTAAMANNVILSDGAGTIRFQSNASGAISLGTGGSYGTAGQILVSGGSGAAPTWTSSGTASANYGSFVRTTTQTNAGGVSGNAVSYDTTSSANNFSIVSGSRITAAVAGTYQILASLQVQKTDAGTDDVNFWVKKNGVNEPNSAYNLTLQGSNAAQLGYINWVVTLAAGEYVELWWYSADANARLLADPAVAPYPAVPASGFIIHPMGA
jgi:hypothetical protein